MILLFHFTKREIEVQLDEVTALKSHSWLGTELALKMLSCSQFNDLSSYSMWTQFNILYTKHLVHNDHEQSHILLEVRTFRIITTYDFRKPGNNFLPKFPKLRGKSEDCFR